MLVSHSLLTITCIEEGFGIEDYATFFIRITIYGSDLLILSGNAPSMPPLLSLSLSMACDDSDGHHENVFAAMAPRSLFYPATAFPFFLPHSPIRNEEATNREYREIKIAGSVGPELAEEIKVYILLADRGKRSAATKKGGRFLLLSDWNKDVLLLFLVHDKETEHARSVKSEVYILLADPGKRSATTKKGGRFLLLSNWNKDVLLLFLVHDTETEHVRSVKADVTPRKFQ
ncbi:hypothetical protein Tco_0646824, partial [Tanacetum coccineum]